MAKEVSELRTFEELGRFFLVGVVNLSLSRMHTA